MSGDEVYCWEQRIPIREDNLFSLRRSRRYTIVRSIRAFRDELVIVTQLVLDGLDLIESNTGALGLVLGHHIVAVSTTTTLDKITSRRA